MYERFSEDFSPPEFLFQTSTKNLPATWSVNACASENLFQESNALLLLSLSSFSLHH